MCTDEIGAILYDKENINFYLWMLESDLSIYYKGENQAKRFRLSSLWVGWCLFYFLTTESRDTPIERFRLGNILLWWWILYSIFKPQSPGIPQLKDSDLPAYYYDDEYFMAGMISRSDVFRSFWSEYCSRGKQL